MRILLASPSRSGGTALYHALKNSLPGNFKCFNLPWKVVPTSTRRSVLTRVLIDGNSRLDDLSQFDKQILLTRDPRDVLVSRCLSAIYTHSHPFAREKANSVLHCIERKQARPQSVSLIDIIAALSDLTRTDCLAAYVYSHNYAHAFGRVNDDYFVYKYEDFCERREAPLATFLGFPLSRGADTTTALKRVARTKSSGDWKHWFTERDIDYFRPVFANYLLRYSYDLDWTPSTAPVILPEYSTEYLKRVIHERCSLSRRLALALDRPLRVLRERYL